MGYLCSYWLGLRIGKTGIRTIPTIRSKNYLLIPQVRQFSSANQQLQPCQDPRLSDSLPMKHRVID